MTEPLAAAGLGFLLGLQHSTDPDHLVAVGTIVTRERRLRDGMRLGLLWGLGHAATLVVAGGLVITLGRVIGPPLVSGLELLVAAAIVGLGAWRLREAFRGAGEVEAAHLLEDHDHGDRPAFHSHPHAHDGQAHRHPHLHPSPRLLAVLGRPRRGGWSVLGVGALHGLAGTAAVSLAVLVSLRSLLAAALYLGTFALGATAGMVVLGAVIAGPVALTAHLRGARRALAFGSGAAAIAFGVFYAVRAVAA